MFLKLAQALDRDLFCRRICSQYMSMISVNYYARLGTFVVLYADDILLLAPSVALLQSLLQECENELNLTDMAINTKKSSCVRIGPRNDNVCAKLTV